MSRPWLVSVLGGECTGKTELCEALSRGLGAYTDEETLRAWVRAMGRPPAQDEQWEILNLQQLHEQEAIETAQALGRSMVLVDSGPVMTAIYSQVYFSDTSLLAQALRWQSRYDLTLICNDDLPWVPDPGQRDGEPFRAAAQAALRVALQGMPQDRLGEVSGWGEARFAVALEQLQRLNSRSR